MRLLGLRFVAHRFNVVSVGPNNKGAVIALVVMRTQAGRPIVRATGFDGSAVEIVDLLASVGHECEGKRGELLGGLTNQSSGLPGGPRPTPYGPSMTMP